MKKYQIIYADPPWSFDSRIRSSKKNGEGNYLQYKPSTTVGKKDETQSDEWIKNLKVSDIASDDCILFLWTTDAHLPLAIDVMRCWGFTYKTIAFIWNKKEVSGKQVCYYGQWTMKGSEICLLGTKGKIHSYIKSHKVRQLVESLRDRTKHSGKPSEVRERITQMMGNLPRIELFARRKVEGWDCWGNEVESDIEL